jgi:hypothetical protein
MDKSYYSTAAAAATCGTSACDMMLTWYGWKRGNSQIKTTVQQREDWKEMKGRENRARKPGKQMRRSHNYECWQ